MPVLPFRWDLVPRITRSELAVRNALSRRAHPAAPLLSPALDRLIGGPARVAISRLWVIATSDLPSRIGAAALIRLEAADGLALLAVDLDLALAAAARALGYADLELGAVRPLGGAEEGVLLYLVADLAGRARLGVRVLGLTSELSLPDPWTIVVELDVELGPARGHARLLLPERLLHALPERAAAIPELELHLPVRRGRARLPADRVGILRLGDVVLFPEAAPRLCVRRHSARVALGPGQAVVVQSQFEEEDVMPEDLLNHAEVDVVVHLGQATITARQLAELQPGAVLELDRPLGGPVELYVGRRMIARGEVVDIDGQLGVRLTEVSRPA